MSYQKIANLVKKIYEMSNDGLVVWEATEKEGTYQLSFSNYSVRLFERYVHQYEGNDYIIQIINSDGELVEETSDVDLKPLWDDSYNSMKHIYGTARRQVMGVENALDSILDELNDKLIPF